MPDLRYSKHPTAYLLALRAWLFTDSFRRLFIASAACLILAAVAASLSTLDAGARGAPAQDVVAVNHAPQPMPVRNTDDFESTAPPSGAVHALFDLNRPETGPFPADIFTVADHTHNTGRRVHLPYPDCAVRVSDCEDLDVINTLDGFGLQTRLSIPFDGKIDPATVTDETVFVISLSSTLPGGEPGGQVIGINQVVWDPGTLTLHVEVNDLLDQHRRYALIVTRGVRDLSGAPVEASEAFRRFRRDLNFGRERNRDLKGYGKALLDALKAARAAGVRKRDVVTASVFTTQSITSVMERINDQIKARTPEPADFLLGPAGERAVFNRSDVTSVVFRQHTTVSPPGFTNLAINLPQLNAVPGAVGTIAYGRYTSPYYLVHPGEYIPAVGTLADTPPVQGDAVVYFTLYLPAGPRPEDGWPIVLIGGGSSTNQHVSSTIFASKMASYGLATIGISYVGQGFGPLGQLVVTKTDSTTMTLPDAGRGFNQNGDNVYQPLEGSEAAAPRTWTISVRDSNRQTVIDFMQLVRVIEVGMDVDGDTVADIDPSRIYYQGASAGAMLGHSFVALDPSVSVAAFVVPPGVFPEHGRWAPIRRAAMGAALQARIPSLINSPGLTAIDGVPIAAPHYNENKPLRDRPIVVNTIAGATEIQQALEFAEMAAESGIGPVPWGKYLRAKPLPGLYPKAVLYLMAKGDQQSVNPGTSALIREGELADRATYYRHDLAFAQDPTIPKNPHLFAAQPTSPNALVRSISLGAQDQIGVFFASGGTVVIQPEPAHLFEVPVAGPLPEDLNYIP